MKSIAATLSILLVLVPIVIFRLFAVLPLRARRKPTLRRTGSPTHLLTVLGSGGHTAEMLILLRDISTLKYTHRTYIVSSGDSFSSELAKKFEDRLFDDCVRADIEDNGWGEPTGYGSHTVETVPRARKIHQSIYSAPFSSLRCLFACLKVLGASAEHGYPDLIITNGPATGVIVVLASVILRFLGLPKTAGKMRSIYVESWARVRKLSLSGKLLLKVVDRFIVQWEALLPATKGRGEHIEGLLK